MRLHRDRGAGKGPPHEIRDLVCSLKNVTTGSLQLVLVQQLKSEIEDCWKGCFSPELRLQFGISEFPSLLEKPARMGELHRSLFSGFPALISFPVAK